MPRSKSEVAFSAQEPDDPLPPLKFELVGSHGISDRLGGGAQLFGAGQREQPDEQTYEDEHSCRRRNAAPFSRSPLSRLHPLLRPSRRLDPGRRPDTRQRTFEASIVPLCGPGYQGVDPMFMA